MNVQRIGRSLLVQVKVNSLVILMLLFLSLFGGKAAAQESRPIVIEGATLIDGNGGPPRENMTIVIRAGRIQEIGQSAQVRRPAGAEVIDGKGKFLIPGLEVIS